MPVDLSVVVCAYNEELRLPGTLATIIPYLAAQDRSFELILSDDGSTDRTLELIRSAAAEDPRLRVVTRSENRGKGRTLADGVGASRGELVLVSDTDFSTPIDELPKVEAAIAAGADVAIGSRAKRGARVEVSQPAHRVLMGKTFNLAVQILLLPGLWDTQCGFKLFRGAAARELFGQLRTDRFAYDVEILHRARRAGYRITEVPVRWINSPASSVAAVRDSSAMLKDIVKIRLGL